MSLPQFKYFEAKSLEQGVALLAEYGEEAKVIAGGTDLMSAMKDRVRTPEVLINIRTIGGLDFIREEEGILKIGVLTSLYRIQASPVIRQGYGLLSEAARFIGSPSIQPPTPGLRGPACTNSCCKRAIESNCPSCGVPCDWSPIG